MEYLQPLLRPAKHEAIEAVYSELVPTQCTILTNFLILQTDQMYCCLALDYVIYGCSIPQL